MRRRCATAILAAGAALLAASSAHGQMIFSDLIPSDEPITTDVVRLLEGKEIMPPGAQALPEYHRYYAPAKLTVGPPERKREIDVVVGVFLSGHEAAAETSPVEGVANAFVVHLDQLPSVDDGGCGVVTTYFDRTDGAFIELKLEGDDDPPRYAVCNGLA
jgi:hypothetical protein